MKVIDCAESSRAGGRSRPAGIALKPLDRFFSNADATAQETLIEGLQKVLDNKNTLLRNVSLPGLEEPVPMVLVGPAGVHVLVASGAKGVFRAREDVWEQMDEHSQEFNLARPNLLARTAALAQAVGAFLEERGHELPDIEPVLFFSEPGAHVESTRPIARIVLADGLDRFAAGVLQGWGAVEPEEAQRVAEDLGMNAPVETALPRADTVDAFSFRDLAEKPAGPRLVTDRSEPALYKKVPFSRKQWIILGVMIVVNIILLAVFAVILLGTT